MTHRDKRPIAAADKTSYQAAWRRLLRFPTRSREHIADDVDAEMAFHLAMREEELRARGLAPDEAILEARRRFGDLDEARRSLRRSEQRIEWATRVRTTWTALRHDVAYAVRRSMREPMFTAVVVVTLALGIGSTVAIASIVQRMLVAPLPYPGADRLVLIEQTTTDGSLRVSASTDLVEALQGATPSIERIERLKYDRLPSTRNGVPVMVPVGLVSSGFLPFLRATPALGRTFLDEDARLGAPPVAMLSWNSWQRRYAGSPGVLDSAITLAGRTYTIVGVMPRLFDPSVFGLMPKSDVWLPLTQSPANHYFYAIGVLREGARLDVAQRELRAASARIPEAKRMKSLSPSVSRLMDLAGAQGKGTLQIMIAAVLLVLFIACMNVANLLLARGAARDREFAVRTAIGASRGRLVRQLLTESVMLSIVGGTLGIALARALLAIVAAWRPVSYAALEDVRIDAPMLIFALLLALVTAVLFGLGPALLNSKGHGGLLQGGMRSVGPGRAGQRTRRVLAFSEVACAVSLVIAATLLVRSGEELKHLRLGYDVDELVTLRVQRADGVSASLVSGERQASNEGARVAALLAPALERVRALADVKGLTVSHAGPGQIGGCMCEFLPEGAPLPSVPQMRFIFMWNADSLYLRTVGTRLLAGRSVSGDTSAHEIMITATAAAKLWRGQSPVGKRFRLHRDSPMQTVVGVIEDQRSSDGSIAGDSVQFAAQYSAESTEPTITVRISGSPNTALRQITRAIEETAPTLRVLDALPMRQIVDEGRAPQRFTRVLLGGFALCALLLAVIGLYGVMSYGVMQRTREIGVRMALGAGRAAITRLIVNEGLGITVAGAVAGCLGSLALNRLLKGMLLGVSSRDLLAYVAANGIVIAAALVALWIPTRRALGVDPVTAVSAE
ncbi:MAG: ADOP family duplicated permease [Gemmatimonadaceae bacterium]